MFIFLQTLLRTWRQKEMTIVDYRHVYFSYYQLVLIPLCCTIFKRQVSSALAFLFLSYQFFFHPLGVFVTQVERSLIPYNF